MTTLDNLHANLRACPRHWLVTGAAGFIGSNILQELLSLRQWVVGLDNFSTGKPENLDEVKSLVSREDWARFRFIEGDISDLSTCARACSAAELVLHQAALGSVPRSIKDPVRSHQSNVSGFLNMLVAARDSGVERLVYASSSSVYGDHPALPKIETNTGKPLSPYAATKAIDEIYAEVFTRTYGLATIGLRYFNVFGPRQDPAGPYAAVIPLWIAALINRKPVLINGDGETSRDFCYVANVVQANLLAATTSSQNALNQVYNIAVGERTTLKQLFEIICGELLAQGVPIGDPKPVHREFRSGDVRHSLADITKAKMLLKYSPRHRVRDGLQVALEWYRKNMESQRFPQTEAVTF